MRWPPTVLILLHVQAEERFHEVSLQIWILLSAWLSVISMLLWIHQANVDFVSTCSAKLLHLSALVLDKIVICFSVSRTLRTDTSHVQEQRETFSLRRAWVEVPYKCILVFIRKKNSHHYLQTETLPCFEGLPAWMKNCIHITCSSHPTKAAGKTHFKKQYTAVQSDAWLPPDKTWPCLCK